MDKKLSRFQRWRQGAEAILNESAFREWGKASRWEKFVHFWVLVWLSFSRNRCPTRASALAYATLLAIIPMLAVVVSVTSTFLKQEGEERIDQFIGKFVASVTPPAVLTTNTNQVVVTRDKATEGPTNNVAAGPAEAAPAAPETQTNAISAFTQNEQALRARKEVAKRIHDFIQNTRSGALGVTGSVLLIFAAISMLSRIESTFNDIWGVERGRSWFMRIILYWGVISLAPVLVIVAIGLASGSHFETGKEALATLPFVGTFLLHLFFQLLPIVLLCLTFSAFYMLMPNTRVHWSAALVGGSISALLFHLNSLVSVLYVSRVVSNSKIYGSLGLVPVFMIGLYFAWLILLFGAQVAYAFQNRVTYAEEKQVENINQRGREFIALRLLTLIGQRFLRGEPPLSVAELGEELGVPTRLIRHIMHTLVQAHLVVETAGGEGGYLPARPMETITCHDVLEALRASRGQELATREEPTRLEVFGEFQRILEAERQAAAAVTMLALAHRAQSQLLSPESGVKTLKS